MEKLDRLVSEVREMRTKFRKKSGEAVSKNFTTILFRP